MLHLHVRVSWCSMCNSMHHTPYGLMESSSHIQFSLVQFNFLSNYRDIVQMQKSRAKFHVNKPKAIIQEIMFFYL